jgi:hypothetical protein
MRIDLLLLLPEKVVQQLPGNAFMAADAAVMASARGSSSDSSSSSSSSACVGDMPSLMIMAAGSLDRVFDGSKVLLPIWLQLTGQLVLLTAVHWQQIYRSITQQQQQQQQQQQVLLIGAEAEQQLSQHQQLKAAENALHYCCVQLQGLVHKAWLREQWQPLLQMVQQQEGEVLLQGLTLALHCTSLDRQFAQWQQQEQDKEPISVQALLNLLSVGMLCCYCTPAEGM